MKNKLLFAVAWASFAPVQLQLVIRKSHEGIPFPGCQGVDSHDNGVEIKLENWQEREQ